jgi:hypothetical protein
LPKEGLITKKEIVILATVTVFAVIWMIWAVPFLAASAWFQFQIPPIQFLLYEMGFVIGLVVALGFPLQYLYYQVKKNAPSRFAFVFGAIKIGLSLWVGNKFIMDMWEAPYYLSTKGVVLLNNPEAMTGTAVDATITWLFQQIGISGFMLYFAVYIAFPLLCLLGIILAFTWKRFVKVFTN